MPAMDATERTFCLPLNKWMAMFWKKREGFVKVFVTARAMVTTFAVMQKSLFSHRRNVFNYRGTVVMNLPGDSFAMGTTMVPARHGKIDMNLCIICLHIINNYIFQFEEF